MHYGDCGSSVSFLPPLCQLELISSGLLIVSTAIEPAAIAESFPVRGQRTNTTIVGMGDVMESPPPYSSVVQDTSNTRQGSQSTQSANRGSMYYQPQDAARQPSLVQYPPRPEYQPPGQFNRPLSHGPEPLGKVYHPQGSAFHPQAPPPPYSGPTQ